MINLDDYGEALQALPIANQCNDTFGIYAVDCGSYRNNLFRICVRKDLLTYSNLKTPFMNFDTNNDDTNVCPINEIKWKSWLNPAQNISDPRSNKYLIGYNITQKI